MSYTSLTGNSEQKLVKKLLIGASLCALVMSVSFASSAQDAGSTDTLEDDEIIATGIRQSLENAQDIKRDADTFVDSITASDIGALPDRSVLEALQRVPGVSISRFAGGDDPDHFSVEGSGVVIRGLSFVRSEFNGRDTFSANNGRALGFQDVPPELVGGVDVFKNQTADMVEGGISGVVNLRTLKPFDRTDRTIAATVDATYTDYADKVSPSVSGLYSNRWDTDSGEFGLLASVAYSNLKSRSSGFRIAPIYPYNPTFTGVGSATATDNIAAPAGASIQDQQFDRDRFGVTLAGQWASNDGKHQATAEFIRSDSTQAWTEHTIQAEEDPNTRAGYRAVGDFEVSPFTSSGILQTRDDTTRVPIQGGLFSNGVITDSSVGWTGRNGIRTTKFTRFAETESVTSDYSFNYKYSPTDSLRLNFDAQYVDATTENQDISVFSANYADIALNLNENSIGLQRNSADNFSEDTALIDPASQFWRAAMDHFEDSEGDELALRADVEYDFNSDGWFDSIRFGGRFAERKQISRWSEYNWANLSEAWNGGERNFADGSAEAPFETFSFSDFRNRGSIVGNTDFLFPAVSLVNDYDNWLALVNGPYLDNSQQNGAAGRSGVIEGTPFRPSEISDLTETNTALYARVDFSNEDFANGITIDGNYGLRLVKYDIDSAGSVISSAITGDTSQFIAANDPNLFALFNSTAPQDRVIQNDETYVLPSFNVKVGLTDDLIMRFAAAKALSYPSTGLLRAYRQLNANASAINNGAAGANGQPGISGFAVSPTVTGGNPNLRPVQAINLDASVEYYFDDVGSFTASFFYKDLSDVIITAEDVGELRTLADGRTIDFNYVGTVNGADGKVKGFELAYQQFYDFLPGWMSGFGVQANYTFVDQSAIPNGGFNVNNAFDRDDPRFMPSDLENLSKHTVNLVGLYENDKVEARLAYNWRSDFLLTTTDVITRLPIYNESTGQLDASLKYQVTDNFKIGVQGVNLLSEVTETSVQIDDDGNRLPRAFFENDRRVSLVGSINF